MKDNQYMVGNEFTKSLIDGADLSSRKRPQDMARSRPGGSSVRVRRTRLIVILLIAGIVGYLLYRYFYATRAYTPDGQQPVIAPTKPPHPKVIVDVYMEALCPDTSNFVTSQLVPTWSVLSDWISLNLYPYGKASTTKTDGGDFTFRCQHGERECSTNILQLCGMDEAVKRGYATRTSPPVPFVACAQGNSDTAEKCITAILLLPSTSSSVPSGFDDVVKAIKDCVTSARGRALHAAAGEKTHALSPKMNFVPWIMVNGSRDRTSLMDLKGAVCKAIHADIRPPACAKTEQPPGDQK